MDVPEKKAVAIDASVKLPLDGPAGPFDLDVSLKVDPGSFVVLVGPSGAGKTTLIRILAGLTKPARGMVRVDDAIWTDTAGRIHVPTRKRSIGFVFQDYALFPNMTVRRHIDYAIGAHDEARIDDLLGLVGLEKLADALPGRLSGGQKQRLALIRALARTPSVLMLDEPLSALDPAMRRQLQDELKKLHRRFGTTTLMVSHDTSDILRLADRVIRLEEGRVVFDGAPGESFGLVSGPRGLHVEGIHVEGPDASGEAIVLIAGDRQRVRYRNPGRTVVAGDPVMLLIDEVVTLSSGSAENGRPPE